MEAIRKPSIIKAIGTVRTMRDEMVETCPDTVQVQRYLAAVDRMVEYITTISDRELANRYLLLTGVLLGTLGLVCGAVGAYHAMHGNPVAPLTGLYAAGFFGFGLLSLLGVRK